MRRIALLMLIATLWTDTDHDGINDAGELRSAQAVVTSIGLGYVRQHRRDRYGNESRYRGFVQVRPEPGLNRVTSADEDRVRPMYDVCLVPG